MELHLHGTWNRGGVMTKEERSEIEEKINALNRQALLVRGVGASAAMQRICNERDELKRKLEWA
jgi:hypothetical protein